MLVLYKDIQHITCKSDYKKVQKGKKFTAIEKSASTKGVGIRCGNDKPCTYCMISEFLRMIAIAITLQNIAM